MLRGNRERLTARSRLETHTTQPTASERCSTAGPSARAPPQQSTASQERISVRPKTRTTVALAPLLDVGSSARAPPQRSTASQERVSVRPKSRATAALAPALDGGSSARASTLRSTASQSRTSVATGQRSTDGSSARTLPLQGGISVRPKSGIPVASKSTSAPRSGIPPPQRTTLKLLPAPPIPVRSKPKVPSLRHTALQEDMSVLPKSGIPTALDKSTAVRPMPKAPPIRSTSLQNQVSARPKSGTNPPQKPASRESTIVGPRPRTSPRWNTTLRESILVRPGPGKSFAQITAPEDNFTISTRLGTPPRQDVASQEFRPRRGTPPPQNFTLKDSLTVCPSRLRTPPMGSSALQELTTDRSRPGTPFPHSLSLEESFELYDRPGTPPWLSTALQNSTTIRPTPGTPPTSGNSFQSSWSTTSSVPVVRHPSAWSYADIMRLAITKRSVDSENKTQARKDFVDNHSVQHSYMKGIEKEECTVCLEDFVNGDLIRRLPCLHLFHLICVDKWLLSEYPQSRNCPVCLTSLDQEETFIETNHTSITSQATGFCFPFTYKV